MTQKELLYLEDATNHEQTIINFLNYSLETATDKRIIRFFESEIEIHNELCKKLLKHMEDISNE